MATIDLKLKTYEQLQFEVNRLVIDNFLKQQELDQYKNNWEELKEHLKAMIRIYENEYKSVDDAEHYRSILSKMKELEENK